MDLRAAKTILEDWIKSGGKSVVIAFGVVNERQKKHGGPKRIKSMRSKIGIRRSISCHWDPISRGKPGRVIVALGVVDESHVVVRLGDLGAGLRIGRGNRGDGLGMDWRNVLAPGLQGKKRCWGTPL